VIIGHSERRQFYGDTDESVSSKVHTALSAGLSPIVCVGETKAEREAGRTLEVVGRQLAGSVAERVELDLAAFVAREAESGLPEQRLEADLVRSIHVDISSTRGG
jgi:triosephosphate isomerase